MSRDPFVPHQRQHEATAPDKCLLRGGQPPADGKCAPSWYQHAHVSRAVTAASDNLPTRLAEDSEPPPPALTPGRSAPTLRAPRDLPLGTGILVYSSLIQGSYTKGGADHALRFCHLGPAGIIYCPPERKLLKEGFALCLHHQKGSHWLTLSPPLPRTADSQS